MEPPRTSVRLNVDFERLHRDFAHVVHGIAVATVGAGDADDAAQDAFLAIHRGLEGVRDATALAAWVCRVARNACTDFARRRGRQVPTAVVGAVEAVVARDVDLADAELAERALALVRSLPETYRETLVLRLVEGLTGPEIADRTGMTPGSVRVNLCRGMAVLRERLQNEVWP